MSILQKEYERKLVLPQEALGVLHDDEKIALGMATSQPPALMTALHDLILCGKLEGLSVYYQHGTKTMADTLLSPALDGLIDRYCFFLSHYDRTEISRVRHIPCSFHQVGHLLTNEIGVTALLVTVSQMSEDGYFSFGCGADYVMKLARHKNVKIIAEVNKHMPYVQGETRLSLQRVTHVVENDQPLMEAHPRPVSEKDRRIARYIADHIEDGCTVQLGIGGVPAAVADMLSNHNDLGIHTELLSPALVNLVRNGNVTGYKKTLLRNQHVFTLALGDKNMYDYMRTNQQFTGFPVSWTNNASIIAQNNKMISVNAAVEVDLLGQVNAEMIGGKHYSGTGGQLDFVRGAYASEGGKSFIALYSTAKNDTISKIVAPDKLGCVTDPRTDVHYVVTEYGIANLKGLCMEGRMSALIEIAHPKFREELRSNIKFLQAA